MDYKYRASWLIGVYRKAPGELAEAYDFKTGEWVVTEGAADAFYEGEGTHPIAPEEVMIEIGKQIERYGIEESKDV